VLGFDALSIYKQVCIIPFRRDALLTFASLAPTPLEQAESVDMMRFLEHGHRVKLVETLTDTHAVDTPEDLILVEQLMQHNPLTRQYLSG
jgi:3-deoxy-manno-octulosonate cytidylyltransferase (CMP-KDO synthetase)